MSEQEQVQDNKQEQEKQQLLVMKAAFIELTAGRGWNYFLKFAETTLRELDRQAIDEEDDNKANGLRRDARGARKFRDSLLQRIQIARSQEFEDNFNEVATD